MRQWSLQAGSPLSLRIAADARLGVPDYTDDHIWELSLDGGEPPGLALETTYGLRARTMRLFPDFVRQAAQVANPAQFAAPPIVRRLLPNYLLVEFSPFADLHIHSEYWVPQSHLVAGRITMRNLAGETQQVRLRLHALLKPNENGEGMSERMMEGALVLAGRSGSLEPVLFMAGGATVEPAAYPALVIGAQLAAGEARSLLWVLASLHSRGASFTAARSFARCAWDAEVARLDLANAGLVDIETGDGEWDAALALGQKVALGSFLGPTKHLPHPSFVLSRLPDRGHSPGGDGKDYGLSWNGQTAAHAMYIVPQVLFAAPELARGVVRNFLSARTADGAIDWKPGMAGQRNGALSMPLLATLAWTIHQHTEDRAFVDEVLPGLYTCFQLWFAKQHDRDQDGYPEWDNTVHAGFDDWPSFVRWQPRGQGLDITLAETPDLASYLYRECQSLISMSRLVGHEDLVSSLEERADQIRSSLESSWSEETVSYHHRDRDTHGSCSGMLLGRQRGSFSAEVERSFEPPVRVLLRVCGPEDQSPAASVAILGRGRQGRASIERLGRRQFQWFWDCGTVTSERTYAQVKRIEVRGLGDDFESEMWAADYRRQDQTLLLPLWAGIPGRDRAQRLIKETLTDPRRYWRAFGIPTCSADDPSYSPGQQGGGGVSMLWNTMLAQAMADYGCVDQAAQLVARLMQATIDSLRKDRAFRETYHPDEPQGLGERDHAAGVAPVYLFLYVLGVHLITPTRLRLRGRNPYPWPVTVRWRGLQVRREGDRTTVTFPNAQQVEIQGEEPRLVEQTA